MKRKLCVYLLILLFAVCITSCGDMKTSDDTIVENLDIAPAD